eukprot:TRINITY_DN739_c0_g3_i1.p1 TRINITY_DN739_c0_g3~~TRINITY_DN739_c0_g3_i1.p1  ORF type:complete len:599 (-),score=234.44 TRINITY_DN739_c0_g3_i1:213-2009(-)
MTELANGGGEGDVKVTTTATVPATANATATVTASTSKPNKKKRKRKKRTKTKPPARTQCFLQPASTNGIMPKSEPAENGDSTTAKPVSIEIEYVSANVDEQIATDEYSDFKSVFSKFMGVEELLSDKKEEEAEKEEEAKAAKEEAKAAVEAAAAEAMQVEKSKGDDDSDSDDDDEDDDDDEPQISRKERKRRKRFEIAVLKQLVQRPDVVEVHDINSADPGLLVHLKAMRNSVPVPRHWSQKSKYLQRKRGIEKAPWQLPQFIADTGISDVRAASMGEDSDKSMKQRQRDRARPKMGKLEIDFQILHDAFFRYQTKPDLLRHGDLYYEGKEFETKVQEHIPGVFSNALKASVGMQTAADPPPWLVNMQRYGPPPSYPGLKIPGLNAPIPAGGAFGYHEGGWGKPPVDELGRPLYGDVFAGADQVEEGEQYGSKHVSKAIWGELRKDEDEDEDESEDEDEDDDDEDEAMEDEVVDPSGIASVASVSGLETPDVIDLRKAKEAKEPKQLYQVLDEKESRVSSGTMMGSSKKYVVPGQQKSGEVDLTLNPEELEEMEKSGADVLERKYYSQIEKETDAGAWSGEKEGGKKKKKDKKKYKVF